MATVLPALCSQLHATKAWQLGRELLPNIIDTDEMGL